MTLSRTHRWLAAALAALLAAAPLAAQEPLPIAPVKPRGLPLVRSYRGVSVPPLRTSSAARLHSMIRSGTLYLTVRDALELALENNLDLEVARYDVARRDWDIQRAQSGGSLRGVTSSSGSSVSLGSGQGVAGSQSSSSSSASSTSSLTGAALIQQIGPVTPQLDPILTYSTTIGHETSIQDQLVQSGAHYFAYSGRSYSAQLSQGLVSGGTIRYSYSGSYLNEAVPTDVLNPTSYISAKVTITHNLLGNFGTRVNDRFIRIAERRAVSGGSSFRLQLISTVTSVLNLYWDLSVAAEDLKYARRNLELARELVRDTQLEIAAGAIPAVDEVRTQSNLSSQQQALQVAENNAVQRENALKDALSWHGRQDPELEAAHIVTVDALVVPDPEQIPALGALLATARANRPDLAIARGQEDIAAMTAFGTANGVLPTLRVSASTSNVGQAGAKVAGQSPDPYFVGGAGTALSQVMRRAFPNESATLSFSAKIDNTQAQADNTIDELSHRQAQLEVQRTASDLARDIALQRLTLLQSSARYRSAIESRRLTEQLLSGEEKKWQAGTSTVVSIVQARRDLATAQSTELAAAAAFLRARIALDQALGVTLESNDIQVESALRQ